MGPSDPHGAARLLGVANRALIYGTELALMGRHMAGYARKETGGELFGLWDSGGNPVVFLATGPGMQAGHHAAAFYQDEAFLRASHARASEFGLQHIGSWHSHHHIGLAEPSAGDRQTVWRALREHGLSRFVLAIGNFPDWNEDRIDFGFTVFSVDENGRESMASVDVDELGAENSIRRIARMPEGRPIRRGARVDVSTRVATRRVEGGWFADPETQLRLRSEIRALEALHLSEGFVYELRLEGDALLLDASTPSGRPLLLSIEAGFPRTAPRVLTPAGGRAHWSANQDLAAVLVELAVAPVWVASVPPGVGPLPQVEVQEPLPALPDSPFECPLPAALLRLKAARRAS